MENNLEVKNLRKKYNGFELKDINLELPKGMIMGWGFFICQTDCKNRKRLTEFWLHKNFIGVHYHGWVDLNQKKLAESCTRHRKFKDNYYVAMETIIPFYVIRKIIFSPRVLWELTKWFIRAWRYNNRNK